MKKKFSYTSLCRYFWLSLMLTGQEVGDYFTLNLYNKVIPHLKFLNIVCFFFYQTLFFADIFLSFQLLNNSLVDNSSPYHQTTASSRTLEWWLECSLMARGTWVQSQVESYQRLKKWYLMPPCLTLSVIRYGSRVKWSNPGNGVAPSPTPWCSSYRKGSIPVTLD